MGLHSEMMVGLVVAAVVVVLIFLLMPIATRWYQWYEPHPTMTPIGVERVPKPLRQYVLRVEIALVESGFARRGQRLLIHDYVKGKYTNGVQFTCQLLVSSEEQTVCVVGTMMSEPPLGGGVAYVSFGTEFADSCEMSTHNLSAFVPLLPNEHVLSLWGVENPAALHAIHQQRVDAYRGRSTVKKVPSSASTADILQRDLDAAHERLQKAGYITFDRRRGLYKSTWKGAYVMTWLSQWPCTWFLRVRAQREARRFGAA